MKNFFNIVEQKEIVNEEKNTCAYKIKLGCGAEFYGFSRCAPEDLDFFNKYTGIFIANLRAMIKVYKFQKSYHKSFLKRLDFSIQGLPYKDRHERNKAYLELSYQYQITGLAIGKIDTKIKELEDELKRYIDEKDKLYNTLRKAREENQ